MTKQAMDYHILIISKYIFDKMLLAIWSQKCSKKKKIYMTQKRLLELYSPYNTFLKKQNATE